MAAAGVRKSHYEVLEADSSMPQATIKALYRQLVLLYHPDKVADKRAEFDAVQQAWSVLGDEARRRAYDRELQTERTTSLRVSVVISLDDCDLDSGTDGETAVAACRCGAQFEAPLGAVERAGKAGIVVNCTSCSLKARIVDDMPTSPDAAAPAGDG